VVKEASPWEKPFWRMDKLMEERIARNQAIFRSANERIHAAAGAYDVALRVPFICECADPTCTEVVRLQLAEYEEIRSDPRRFFNVPGHQTAAQGVGVVVEERDGYFVVEKVGHAGDISEALDERTSDPDLGRAASDE
jgi:hypothetical protein